VADHASLFSPLVFKIEFLANVEEVEEVAGEEEETIEEIVALSTNSTETETTAEEETVEEEEDFLTEEIPSVTDWTPPSPVSDFSSVNGVSQF